MHYAGYMRTVAAGGARVAAWGHLAPLRFGTPSNDCIFNALLWLSSREGLLFWQTC